MRKTFSMEGLRYDRQTSRIRFLFQVTFSENGHMYRYSFPVMVSFKTVLDEDSRELTKLLSSILNHIPICSDTAASDAELCSVYIRNHIRDMYGKCQDMTERQS